MMLIRDIQPKDKEKLMNEPSQQQGYGVICHFDIRTVTKAITCVVNKSETLNFTSAG